MSITKKLAFILLCMVVSAGCSKKTETISTPNGTVEIEKSGDKVSRGKITSKEGTTNISSDKVTEAEMGVPIYPGAEVKEGGNIVFNGTNNKKSHTVILNTSDAEDKIAAFYREKLQNKNPHISEMGNPSEGTKMTHFVMDSNTETSMVVTSQDKKNNKTIITITKSPK